MPIPLFVSPAVRFLAFKDVRQKIEGYGMEVYIEYLRGVQFEIKAGQHSLLSDQPVENGGQGGGLTPPELLMAALGSCAAYYALLYVRKRSLALKVPEYLSRHARRPTRLD